LIPSFTLSYQFSHLFTLSILYFLFNSFFIVFIPIPVLSDETLPNFIKRKRPTKGEKKKQRARTKVNSPKEVGHKEEREPLRMEPSTDRISTKDRGGKPHKIPGLDKPSPVVTTCLQIEAASILCNVIYTFCL
jgi:hypothetical protein